MSGLSSILSPAQLAKHYEVMKYLTQHPNQSLTVQQLDYILPHGASLRRFPSEWLGFVREGGCAHHNVELVDDSATVETAAFICHQPLVESLAELRTLIQSPADQLDAEGCIALHTEQVQVSPALVYAAQLSGCAYYFSNERISQETAARSAAAGAGPGAPSEADAYLSQCASGGVPHTFQLNLPPGVHMRHQLTTHRGVVVRDEHCLPLRLHVRERLVVVLDNTNAVAKGLAAGAQPLRVALEQRGWRRATERDDAPEPLRCRISSLARGGAGNGPSQVRLAIEARRAAHVKVLLTVNDFESIVEVDVVDAETAMPGVLLGRERHPSTFDLPPRFVLRDPVVAPATVAASEAGADADVEEAEGEGEGGGQRARRRLESGGGGGGFPPLPWWQSPSPLTATLREFTYPDEETVRLAVEAVYTKESRQREAELRSHKAQADRKLLEEAEANRGKRRFRRSRGKDITNLHMIHYGLDLSVPFTAGAPL